MSKDVSIKQHALARVDDAGAWMLNQHTAVWLQRASIVVLGSLQHVQTSPEPQQGAQDHAGTVPSPQATSGQTNSRAQDTGV